jgi:DNA protecting protein DprA
VLCSLDEGYPRELLHFEDHPLILYYHGNQSLLNQASAAIVGSRKSTAYGKNMASLFSESLARAGFCIVSGMAKGIDAAAHEGALRAGRDTVAVLGCGVDIAYPPDNKRLYWRIREEGLVVSEYFPGEKPLKWHFPLRNRIISGLGRFLLLVECEARSGALITCDWAAEQGKDIWALPGPVTNPYSIGPLQLIQDGALVAVTPEDILRAHDSNKTRSQNPVAPTALSQAALSNSTHFQKPLATATLSQTALSQGMLSPTIFSPIKKVLASLSECEKNLYEFISYYPIHVDSLIAYYTKAQCGKAQGSLFLDLTKLQALRLIEKLPGDYYQRI